MRKIATLSIVLLFLLINSSKTVFSSEDQFVTVCSDQFCYQGNQIKIKGYHFSRKDLPSWWLHVSDWNESSIINDLKLAKNNGANTVRIFLPFSNAFSDLEGNIPAINKERLLRFIQLAKSEGLKVTITLFVWFADDNNWPYDWPQQQTDFNPNNSGYKNSFSRIDNYINQIVGPLKDEKGILSWGLFNEPEGVYWDKENNREGWKLPWMMHFIKHTRDYIKSIDTNHLITTGVVFPTSLSKKYTVGGETYSLGDLSDYLSIHEYTKNDSDINSRLVYIKQNSNGKPIVIEEIGWTTGDFQGSNGWPDGTTSTSEYTESRQAQRINAGLSAAKTNNIAGFLVWILIDQNVDTQPVKFGLFNANGSPKQAASLMLNLSLFPYNLFDAVNLPSSPVVPANLPGCGAEIDYISSDQTAVTNGCNALGQNCSSLGKPYPAYMVCHQKIDTSFTPHWVQFGPSCTPAYCTCTCVGATTSPISTTTPIVTLTPTPTITPTPSSTSIACGSAVGVTCCTGNNNLKTCSSSQNLYCPINSTTPTCQSVTSKNSTADEWSSTLDNFDEALDFNDDNKVDGLDYVHWLRVGHSL